MALQRDNTHVSEGSTSLGQDMGCHYYGDEEYFSSVVMTRFLDKRINEMYEGLHTKQWVHGLNSDGTVNSQQNRIFEMELNLGESSKEIWCRNNEITRLTEGEGLGMSYPPSHKGLSTENIHRKSYQAFHPDTGIPTSTDTDFKQFVDSEQRGLQRGMKSENMKGTGSPNQDHKESLNRIQQSRLQQCVDIESEKDAVPQDIDLNISNDYRHTKASSSIDLQLETSSKHRKRRQCTEKETIRLRIKRSKNLKKSGRSDKNRFERLNCKRELHADEETASPSRKLAVKMSCKDRVEEVSTDRGSSKRMSLETGSCDGTKERIKDTSKHCGKQRRRFQSGSYTDNESHWKGGGLIKQNSKDLTTAVEKSSGIVDNKSHSCTVSYSAIDNNSGMLNLKAERKTDNYGNVSSVTCDNKQIKVRQKNRKSWPAVDKKQQFIQKVHRKIARLDSDGMLSSSEVKTSGFDDVDLSQSQLENIIPLDAVSSERDRKAKTVFVRNNGVLYRRLTNDAIWESVVSKYI